MDFIDNTPVRCGRCKWEGKAMQLKPVYVPNPTDPTDVLAEPGCPACMSDQYLEYKED